MSKNDRMIFLHSDQYKNLLKIIKEIIYNKFNRVIENKKVNKAFLHQVKCLLTLYMTSILTIIVFIVFNRTLMLTQIYNYLVNNIMVCLLTVLNLFIINFMILIPVRSS